MRMLSNNALFVSTLTQVCVAQCAVCSRDPQAVFLCSADGKM